MSVDFGMFAYLVFIIFGYNAPSSISTQYGVKTIEKIVQIFCFISKVLFWAFSYFLPVRIVLTNTRPKEKSTLILWKLFSLKYEDISASFYFTFYELQLFIQKVHVEENVLNSFYGTIYRRQYPPVPVMNFSLRQNLASINQ